MLPLVRQIVRDLVDVQESVELQRAQMEGIAGLQPVGLAPYSEEVQAVQRALQADRQRLDECRRELGALGVRIHAEGIGAVDFPAYLDDQPVVLCWRLDEKSVGHWHELDAPLENRRRIAGESFRSERSDGSHALPHDGFPPVARS